MRTVLGLDLHKFCGFSLLMFVCVSEEEAGGGAAADRGQTSGEEEKVPGVHRFLQQRTEAGERRVCVCVRAVSV